MSGKGGTISVYTIGDENGGEYQGSAAPWSRVKQNSGNSKG